MSNWTDYISDHQYINLLVSNGSLEPSLRRMFHIPCRKRGITVSYDEFYPITNITPGLRMSPPNFIVGSGVQSFATQDSSDVRCIPHSNEPAPAQKAGNIAFMWGSKHGSDFHPYREVFPAVIIAINLSKHYHYGDLHRKRKYPAIKAEYVVGMWFEKLNTNYRGNGPSIVVLENYKEYWDNGKFIARTWSEYNLTWTHRTLNTPPDEDTLGEFLKTCAGKLDMCSNTFFTDPLDEVFYLTDFA